MPQPEAHGSLEVALDRAEQAEAKYRSLVEMIQAITYTEEVDSQRTFAINPQIETILGYTQEEWMGDANLWIERIHPEDRDRVVAACEVANRARESYREEYRIMSRDGRTVWVHDEAVLVRDSHGQPLCWQGVLSVISPPEA